MLAPSTVAEGLLNVGTAGVYGEVRDFASGANEFSVSYVTAPNKETAEKLANALVGARLAPCVNIIPGVTSIYRWEGEIKKDSEVILMIKSPTCDLEKMAAFVKANHPYEVCEVISTLIKAGNPDYIKYLREAQAMLNVGTGGVYGEVKDLASGANEFSVSYVTTPNQETAEKIANALVDARLAACVTIIPGATTICKCDGQIKKETEIILMIESQTAELEKMTNLVKENHSSKGCKVISTLIKAGNPDYIKYLRDETKKDE